MQFTLPLPPPLNHTYRSAVSKYGRPYTYVVPEAKKWQADAFKSILYQVKDRPAYDIPTMLRLNMFLKRNRDYDSSLKLFGDILETTGILKNDRFIFRAEIEKFITGEPHLEAEIVPYAHPVDAGRT